jgi:GrpB-like predicted nucleotidyltransferase (UPF0157 family)
VPEPVVIAVYNPEWPALFLEIAEPIQEALGEVVVTIEHVGSTAVPGLAAKPIIDIDVVVRSQDDVPAAIEGLHKLGYRHRGDLGVPGREAFSAPSDARAQHVYVVVDGNQPHLSHLGWRDLLRANPILAQDYGELKETLAAQYGTDRVGYTRAKTEFITGAMNSTLQDGG